ncbi:MAG: MFS transporter, partial [Bacillota bacterium]|nr:MFS transporter [Bacillota bacterium]
MVYSRTHSQAAVSLLGAAGLAPAALAFLGGWVADLLSRRMLLVVTDLVRFLFVIAAGIGLALLHLPVAGVLVAVVLVTAAGGVLFSPTLDALLPSYASGPRLVQANGLLSSTLQLAAVLGALAAGALTARAPGKAPGVVHAVDALSFLVSLGSILLLPPEGDPAP